MRTWNAILLGTLLGACGELFPPDPKSDGAQCENDDECRSESCYGGEVCAFSSCNDQSDCGAGFACDEAPTWVEVVSFGTAKGNCVPDCSVCPEGERWSCEGEDNRCWFDATPRVDAGGPYEGVVGEPVQLSAAVELAPDRELMEVQWSYNGEPIADTLEAEVVFEDQTWGLLSLLVTDDEGSAAGADASLTLCIPAGTQCNPYSGGLQCCDPMSACEDLDEDGVAVCG